MRLTSALIGALTVVFAFLLARELAPGRPWLWVLAALLVAYQPMYGFISGAVNNDVGVNAGAAALELLLIMMLRRGVTLRLGLLAGALLVGLPVVKGTAYSLYPVAGIVLLATLWRHHRRADIPGWTALVATALALRESSARFAHVFHPAAVGASTPLEVGAPVGAVSEALAHPLGYLGYLWQVFLPRLPFMARHWETTNFPGFVIFVERGWGAFGWYDVLYPHRFYYVILAAMIAVPILGLIAIRREWPFVRRPPAGARDPRVDAARRRRGCGGGVLHHGHPPGRRRIRPLRLSSDRPAGGACRRQPARVRQTLDGVRGRRPARRDDRPQLFLAAADPDRVLCVR